MTTPLELKRIAMAEYIKHAVGADWAVDYMAATLMPDALRALKVAKNQAKHIRATPAQREAFGTEYLSFNDADVVGFGGDVATLVQKGEL